MVKPASTNFQPLTELALTIMVGLTGVGKTTVLALLQETGPTFTLLPNRREITDAIIIASIQREDRDPPHPLTDRIKRFEYTARYRAKHPGGMAYALSQLAVDPEKASTQLIFDGLRGLNEIQHAVEYFPKARFVVLDAPDTVRLQRLLKRGDDFDRTAIHTSLLGKNLMAALIGIPDIEAVFNEDELHQIAKSARAAKIPIDTVVQKAKIIVEERRNYDSRTARVHLTHALPPDRVLIIDTAGESAQNVTQRIIDWL